MSAASLKIGRRDKLRRTTEAELVLLCQWWKVTEDIYINAVLVYFPLDVTGFI